MSDFVIISLIIMFGFWAALESTCINRKLDKLKDQIAKLKAEVTK